MSLFRTLWLALTCEYHRSRGRAETGTTIASILFFFASDACHTYTVLGENGTMPWEAGPFALTWFIEDADYVKRNPYWVRRARLFEGWFPHNPVTVKLAPLSNWADVLKVAS